MVVTKLSILQDSISSLVQLDLESVQGFGRDAAEFRGWQAREQEPETMKYAEDDGGHYELRDSEAKSWKTKGKEEPRALPSLRLLVSVPLMIMDMKAAVQASEWGHLIPP